MFPRSSLAIIFRSDHTSHDGHQHIHVATHDYHVSIQCSWVVLRPSSKLSRVCPQINTSLKIAVCGRSCYKGVSTGSQFAMMTHKQTQKLNTLPFDTAVAEK